jgi:hypothetical protein
MRRIFSIALAVLILATFIGSAAASSTNYNGNSCKTYLASHAPWFDHQANGIRNLHTVYALYINCPLPNDRVTSSGVSTSLYWTAQNFSDILVCSLAHLDSQGNPKQSTVNIKQWTGWLSLYLPVSETWESNYSLFCLLPPGGILNFIYSTE